MGPRTEARFPVTLATSLAKTTIQFAIKDLQFKQSNGVSTATVYVHGRVESINGVHPVTYFEEAVRVEVPTAALPESANGSSVYRNALPLLEGRYRLSVAAKDANNGRTTVYETELDVPTLTAVR